MQKSTGETKESITLIQEIARDYGITIKKKDSNLVIRNEKKSP